MKTKIYFGIELNQVLRKIREEQKLDQLEVAKKLGFSRMGLSYLERGKRKLKLEDLEKWVDLLGYELKVDLVKKP